MIRVVYGGSGSGKSEYAENIAVLEKHSNLYYIATMEPYDDESFKKIERHRLMRQSKNFQTIECFTDISSIVIDSPGLVLLECMSNLVANEIFSDKGAKEDAFSSIKKGIDSLRKQSDNLIIVTNNLFEDGTSYGDGTKMYLDVLSKVNKYICEIADYVTEVVHGIAINIA